LIIFWKRIGIMSLSKYFQDFQSLASKYQKEFSEKSLTFKIGCGSLILILYVIKKKLTEKKRETVGDAFMPTGTSEVDPKFYAILNEQFLAKGLKLAHRKFMGHFAIQVTDVDVADKIFKTHFHGFPHRMMNERSFGAGAEMNAQLNITYNMKQWKRLRSTLSRGFSQRNKEEMLPQVKSVIEHLVKMLKKRNGRPVGAKTIGGKFSMDAFLKSAMSVDLDAQKLEEIEDFEKLEIFQKMNEATNFPPAMIIAMAIPYLGKFLDFIGISTMTHAKWVRNMTRKLIADRIANTSGRKTDFINLMIADRITEEQAKTATKGMTEIEIVGNFFVLFGAGFDTTQQTIQWTLRNLAMYPQYQKKIREELKDLDLYQATDYRFENAPWLCATIAETLRLFPPVLAHFRKCTQDVNINGIEFKSGDLVEILVGAMHKMEEYWGSDCVDFFPARWIEDPSLLKASFYTPFGAGSRNCIGMRLALMQTKVAIAYLVKNFEIKFADEDSKKITFTGESILARASGPINLVFTPLL